MARTVRSATTPGRSTASAADPLPIAAEVARLEALDLPELRVGFRNHTGRIAPARISRALLLRVLAYRVQADAQGDLRPETRRLLARMADTATAGNGGSDAATVAAPAVPPRAKTQLGTVLVREWQGCMERVSVARDGYVWAGVSYPSLSAVATAITGTRWNGRRFFGLDRPAAKLGAGR